MKHIYKGDEWLLSAASEVFHQNLFEFMAEWQQLGDDLHDWKKAPLLTLILED